MKIDLHVHSTCSDGNLSAQEIIKEAKSRNINLLSITDHDSINCQNLAKCLSQKNQIHYIYGIELNITFSHPKIGKGTPNSLDILCYQFDINNKALQKKLEKITKYRQERAAKILENLNTEFKKEGLKDFTKNDLKEIQRSADGALGRPHIADYMIRKGIVTDRKEAFEKYLIKCNIPKYPIYLEDASKLLRNAGGIVILAHPNDPYGTSLTKLTKSLQEQTNIIEEYMLPHIDGIECWHSRNTTQTTEHYKIFSKKHGLIMTGGTDCHQKPIIMGTVKVPDFVAQQFIKK
jgi:predicted metal-dependent phosphoesterase TrpH